MPSKPPDHPAAPHDVLIPDPQVCKRYSVSSMTLWRWDRRPEMNFPPPIRINRRKYRSADALREFERSLAAKV